jgi:hypothetical protein
LLLAIGQWLAFILAVIGRKLIAPAMRKHAAKTAIPMAFAVKMLTLNTLAILAQKRF